MKAYKGTESQRWPIREESSSEGNSFSKPGEIRVPKAESLFDSLVWLETCGNHIELNAYHHCAKVEVEAAFGHWRTNQVY